MSHSALGPAVLPWWIRDLFPFSKEFNIAARAHDNLYNGYLPREEADYVFFHLCSDACISIAMVNMAYIYFYLVRVFGWIFYKKRLDYL